MFFIQGCLGVARLTIIFLRPLSVLLIHETSVFNEKNKKHEKLLQLGKSCITTT